MSRYFLVRYAKEKRDGYAPVLPRGTGFLLLADAGFKSKSRFLWGLLRCDKDVTGKLGVTSVSESLHGLLESAERYPPAMARASFRIERYCERKRVTKTEFLREYEKSLRFSLRQQPKDRFVLAEAARTEPGYLDPGEFCWILKYYPQSRSVSWIAGDYSVYTNPASDFKLDAAMLRQLHKGESSRRSARKAVA